NSKIEWTEATWNPVAGCTIISPGCTNCYAMRLAARLAVMGQEKYVGTTRKTGGRHKMEWRYKERPSLTRTSATMEKGAAYLRQLDVRSVPRGGTARIHQSRLQSDDRDTAAYLSVCLRSGPNGLKSCRRNSPGPRTSGWV